MTFLAQNYGILHEEKNNQQNSAVFSKEDSTISMKKFLEDIEFCRLTCKDVYSLNLEDYLKYTNKFDDQQKIIKQYLEWFLNVGDLDFFTNSIVKRKDFEYKKVVISPDILKLAVLDYTNFITVYEIKTKKQLGRFQQKDISSQTFFFSFNSLKLIFYHTGSRELMIFDIETASFEKKLKIRLSSFIFSKYDYKFASTSRQTITIFNFDLNEIKKNESSSILCGEFIGDIFCYSIKYKIFFWDFKQKKNISTIQTDTSVNQMCFSNSGYKLVTSDDEKMIKLYFFSEGKPLDYQKPEKIVNLNGHGENINFLLISHNEEFILSREGTSPCKIFLWSSKKNDDQYVADILNFEFNFLDLKPLSDKFIGVTADKEIHYLNPLSPFQKIKDVVKFDKCIYSLNNECLISIISDKKCALINQETGITTKFLTLENKEDEILKIEKCFFSNDGVYLIVQTEKFLYIYEVPGPSTALKFNQISLKDCPPFSILIMSKKGLLITGHEEGEMNYFSGKTFNKNTINKEHSNKVTAFAYDLKEELLASGDEKGNLYFWDKDLKKIEGNENKNEEQLEIKFLLFSKKQNGIVFVLYYSQLEIYDFQKKVCEKIKFDENYLNNSDCSLSVSNDENLLIINVGQGAILILQKNEESYNITRGFSNIPPALSQVILHPKKENNFICKFDHGIYELNKILEKKTLLIKERSSFRCFGEKTFISHVWSEDNVILNLLNPKTGKHLAEIKENIASSADLLLSGDEKSLLVKDEKNYRVWDLEKNMCVFSEEEKQAGWIYQTNSGRQKKQENLVAFAKDCREVYIWENGKRPFSKKIYTEEHKKDLISLDFSFDDKKLLVAFTDRALVLNTINYKEENNINLKAEENIEKGLFSWANYHFYLQVTDGSKSFIRIIDASDMSFINQIDPTFHNLRSFLVEPRENYLFLIYSDMISICKPLQSKDKLILWRTDSCNFYITKTSDLFIYYDNLEIYYNFIENSTLFQETRNIFQKLLNIGIEDPEKSQNCNYKSMVTPFNFNLLHICAYEKEKLTEDLLKNKNLPMELFFLKDIHNRNCFDITSETREPKVYTEFLNYILRSGNSMPVLNDLEEKHCFNSKFLKQLMKMFEDNPKFINSFLTFLFANPIDFPEDFPATPLKQTILITSDSPILNEEKINEVFVQNSTCFEKENLMKEIVRAKTLYCSSLLDYNQEETIELFKEISQLDSTNEIFSHVALIKILEYKWNTYAKSIYFREALSFLIFLVMYLLNANYFFILRIGSEDSDAYIYSLILDTLILFFVLYRIYDEGQQMIATKLENYFSSFWNYIDIILLIFGFCTTISDIFSCFHILNYSSVLKVMHAFTVFFGYFRILSYARGFEGSSFMIKLIIQVVFDIRYFLLLMFIFIFALTSSVYVLQSTYQYNPIDVFISFFREMIGDLGDFDEISEEVDYMVVLYSFFFIATIVLTIAMLNLLIAIISDTFSKVKNAENLTKIWEKWNIITEIDIMLFKKNKGKAINNPQDNKFLMFIFNECQFKQEKTLLEEISEKSKENFEKIDQFQTSTKENFEKMEKKIEEMEKFHTNNYTKIEENFEKICKIMENVKEDK